MVQRLSRGPAATSELARPFPMALPSFLQHLEFLQRCGLVKSRESGRVRTYELAPGTLRAAEDWMATRRLLWERRLDQLDSHLEDLKEPTERRPWTRRPTSCSNGSSTRPPSSSGRPGRLPST